MKSKMLAAILAGGLLAASPVFAHHGLAPYDKDHPVTLNGTVTGYDFTNPHIIIRFDVKEANGTMTPWTAESAPPQKMYRAGWTRISLKPGDQITVTGIPLKDGQKKMSIKKLVAPNAPVLSEGAD